MALTDTAMDYHSKGSTGKLRDYIFNSEGQAKIKGELGNDNVKFNTTNNEITYKEIVFTIAENGSIVSFEKIEQNNEPTGYAALKQKLQATEGDNGHIDINGNITTNKLWNISILNDEECKLSSSTIRMHDFTFLFRKYK